MFSTHADKDIAKELDLTYDGFRYRVRRILAKLQARGRYDAVHRARALGSLPRGASVAVPDLSPPDIDVISFAIRESRPQHAQVAVGFQNLGDRAAGVTIRYYRSTDETISRDDTNVYTEFSLNNPIGGHCFQRYGNTIGRDTSDRGPYYYGACVDVVPGEVNTANNCSEAKAHTWR